MTKRKRKKIGNRFGKLKIIEFVVKRSHTGHKQWRCLCDCGTVKTVSAHNLGQTTNSCGCARGLPRGESSFNEIFRRYIKDAKRRNVDFSLSKNRFKALTKQNCYYCNSPPSQISRRKDCKGEYIYNGIDRVNNDKGYTYKNCVACCKVCNKMKMSLSKNKFIEHVINVYRNLRL